MAIKIIRQIPRLKVDMEIVKRLAHFNLVDQKKSVKSVQFEIRYKSVELFQRDMFNDNFDIIWTVAFHLPQHTPVWSGYRQMLHHNLPHPGKSSDIFLLMIDLTPSDPTCVRPTLK